MKVNVIVSSGYKIIMSNLGDDILVLFDNGQNEILTFNQKRFALRVRDLHEEVCKGLSHMCNLVTPGMNYFYFLINNM